MKLIDTYHLLAANQAQLLHRNVGAPFSFGGFKSLDDILTQLDVEVIIEPGIVYHSVPESLKDAAAFWKGLAGCKSPSNYRITHLKDFTFHNANLDSTKIVDDCDVYETAINIYEKILKEKESLSQMPIRGLYDPEKNCIKLYPEEMRQEYSGMRMNELLVSTLAHETMHAYFNRPGHDKFPYVYFVEEPLAEFGMLFYLHKIGSSFYNWAHTDVNSKDTCYQYGALINLSNSSNILFLTNYKILLPTHSMLLLSLNGTILLKTATGIGTIPVTSPMPTPKSVTGITPVPQKMKSISKRDTILTTFNILYNNLGNDLTYYLQLNLINGTLTRTPATIVLTTGAQIDTWKWAPTGSTRAILLEVKKADYPQLSTYTRISRYFNDTYEASKYPDSYFLLSNQWGGGNPSFSSIIIGFCKSVNNMVPFGRLVPYFPWSVISFLTAPIKGVATTATGTATTTNSTTPPNTITGPNTSTDPNNP